MPTVRRHNVADHAARTAGSPRLRGPRTLRVRLVVTIVLVIAAVCADRVAAAIRLCGRRGPRRCAAGQPASAEYPARDSG